MLCTIGLVFVTCINTLYACNIVQFSQVENNCIQDFYYTCTAATGLPSYLYSYYIHRGMVDDMKQIRKCSNLHRVSWYTDGEVFWFAM